MRLGASVVEAYSGSEGGFRLERLANGWQAGRFTALEAIGIPHLVTTREGPDVQRVRRDSAAAGHEIARVLGAEGAAFLEQVHGGEVLLCEREGCAGFADGLATARTGLAVLGKSGDCPIILLGDRQNRAVGFAHASWRATVAGIAPATVRRLVDLGCRAEDLVACICPSAGPCCYEVGQEVREAAIEGIGLHAANFFLPSGWQRQAKLADGQRVGLGGDASSPKHHFDLWQANADALMRCGVPAESIHIAGICTLCRNDLFPSHRREGDSAGRFAAVIALAGPASL